MLRTITKKLKAFHADEGGADLVEYILVLAAIALPLTAIVIWFGDEISAWAKGRWGEVKTGEGVEPPDP